MMTIVSLIALALAAPDAESLELGRQVAESGTLASLLPVLQAKETEEIVAAHPELSTTEQQALRATAKRVYVDGRERLMTAEAKALAEYLSAEDLRAIAAYQQSPAANRHRAAMPEIIAATMQAVGQMDFKKDVRTAFCEETGKLCE